MGNDKGEGTPGNDSEYGHIDGGIATEREESKLRAKEGEVMMKRDAHKAAS